MKDGFIKVASVSFELKVADVMWNRNKIFELMEKVNKSHVKIAVFPELSITGYTAGDLFFQNLLLKKVEEAISFLIKKSKGMDTLFAVGLPILFEGRVYNSAAIFSNGNLLGIVPKLNLPDHDEFYERRYFNKGFKKVRPIFYAGFNTYIGALQIFRDEEIDLNVGVELCEDLWINTSPSNYLSSLGANVIINLSSSNELMGKACYRRELVKVQSKKLLSAYIYSSSGLGESTQDTVFSGHCIIASDGEILSEKRFFDGFISTEIDIEVLMSQRRRSTTFNKNFDEDLKVTLFKLNIEETTLSFPINKIPFLKSNKDYGRLKSENFEKDNITKDYLSDGNYFKEESEDIINILTYGLIKRIKHINTKSVVIGVSGGLDSTLTLLIAVNAFDMLSLDRKNIYAITMPGFGTSDRTHNNANDIMDILGVTKMEIPITNAMKVHFKDIGQDENKKDVTYENSQARERMQILMDYANKVNGLVLGTGDLSELVLGFTTYNGDHMSMYSINAGVPKTLIRVVLRYLSCKYDKLKDVLIDIIETPVSPELVKEKAGEISQKTENIVGPYEINDFFIYYMLQYGFSPKKIYRLAIYAFSDIYDKDKIKEFLKNFYKRFFNNQFKRSCMPDGVKVLNISLSPRGNLRMPSDATSELWVKEVEEI